MASRPGADADRARRRHRRRGARRDAGRCWPKIEELAQALPLGYGIDVGGATESSTKAERSIVAVMPLTIIVVLLLLMLQLQDMKKMALVLLTAPLGLIGVAPSWRPSAFRSASSRCWA